MTVVVTTDLTTDEARRRPDGEMVLSVTTTEATPEYARDLTDRIKVAVDVSWALVKEAYQTRVYAVLGYSSWDDYCVREFGTSRIRVPREERPEAVTSLRDAGLSIRAIASAVGADPKTVRRDLETGGPISPTSVASGETPEPKSITGTDGKTYAPKPPKANADLKDFTAALADGDTDYAAASYRKSLAGQLVRTGQLALYEVDRVVETSDAGLMQTIDECCGRIAAWHESLIRARSGMRVLKGGQP